MNSKKVKYFINIKEIKWRKINKRQIKQVSWNSKAQLNVYIHDTKIEKKYLLFATQDNIKNITPQSRHAWDVSVHKTWN